MAGKAIQEMMYSIYKITSPSGRSYIGLTKSKIEERWRQHKKRAFSIKENHPFYNAIRKYGPENFTLERIDTAENKEEAQRLEILHIQEHGLSSLYNISPGGEADGEAGSKVFWDRINSDPEGKIEYVKKLSESKLKDDWSDYSSMSAKAAEWRKQNPKEAYRLARRGCRIANRGVRKPTATDELSLKERLMRKHKIGSVRRVLVTRIWADRSDTEKEIIGSKISEQAKARWSEIEDPNLRSAKTQAARDSIDRSKQGPAASRGLKKFWADLKANPEEYASYMAKRKESRK